MTEIRPADLREIPIVRQLFREYSDSLDIDLYFQDFEEELELLPGKYSPPQGRLMLAWVDGSVAGCVALRRIDNDTCEMKRLYVKPRFRKQLLGRQLAERICNEALEAGYQKIFLDTIPSMTSAIRLYTALGFKPIEPYVFNPIEGAMFFGLNL